MYNVAVPKSVVDETDCNEGITSTLAGQPAPQIKNNTTSLVHC